MLRYFFLPRLCGRYSGSPVELNLQAQEFDQPFAWPEIHVPTAQELGLTD
jgi:hypothetical protein